MKIVAALLIGGIILAGLEPMVFAEEGKEKGIKVPAQIKSYPRQAAKKLSRGAINLARSGTEFYFQPKEARWRSGKKISMLWPGLGEGCGMFLTRLFGGLIEVVTFALPFPNGWKPILDE